VSSDALSDAQPAQDSSAAWRPLERIPRRILGVLVEKAKTTPDNYPLSLNALVSGCNQKSNRAPQLSLTAEDVEDALEQLRQLHAVAEVHGDGRVIRYRHYAKEWLGIEGTELAVMAELLLRGTQTIGELRGRAARMASGQIPDMSSLKPILQSLIEKNLVVAVSPAGRGQLVTHALHAPQELQRILNESGSGRPASLATEELPERSATFDSSSAIRSSAIQSDAIPSGTREGAGELAELREEVNGLREELARVKKDVADLWSSLQ
jgi:uncharacterized protein YceH (UPF0502 family)